MTTVIDFTFSNVENYDASSDEITFYFPNIHNNSFSEVKIKHKDNLSAFYINSSYQQPDFSQASMYQQSDFSQTPSQMPIQNQSVMQNQLPAQQSQLPQNQPTIQIPIIDYIAIKNALITNLLYNPQEKTVSFSVRGDSYDMELIEGYQIGDTSSNNTKIHIYNDSSLDSKIVISTAGIPKPQKPSLPISPTQSSHSKLPFKG